MTLMPSLWFGLFTFFLSFLVVSSSDATVDEIVAKEENQKLYEGKTFEAEVSESGSTATLVTTSSSSQQAGQSSGGRGVGSLDTPDERDDRSLAEYGERQKLNHSDPSSVAETRDRLTKVHRYMQKVAATNISACSNTDEFCTYWAALGWCQDHPIFMMNSCAPSCYACSVAANDFGQPQQVVESEEDQRSFVVATRQRFEAVQQYWRDVVSRDPRYESARTSCLNQRPLCTFWAAMNECEHNPSGMVHFCAPACFACDKLLPQEEEKTGRQLLLPKADDRGYVAIPYGKPQLVVHGNASAELATREQLVAVHKYMEETVYRDPAYADTRDYCLNQAENCTKWAAEGECQNYVNYMTSFCAPACNLCHLLRIETPHDDKTRWLPPVDSQGRVHILYGLPQVVETANDGQGESTVGIRQRLTEIHQYMQDLVNIHPKYEATRDRCLNQDEMCTKWAAAGECEKNPSYMKTQCAPACFSCENDDGFVMLAPMDSEGRVRIPYGEPQMVLDDNRDGMLAAATSDRLEGAHRYMQETVYKNSSYETVRGKCLNREALCTQWAAEGECDKNPRWMKLHCAPACYSCEFISFETRCPINESAPVAWSKPGDLNAMFERITSDPYYQQYQPKIILQPGETNDAPWVVTLETFLTAEECQVLIELGTDSGYKISEEVGEERFDGTFNGSINERRTSTNAWCHGSCFEHPITQRVLAKIANLTGIPDANGEHMQLLRYEVGQFYDLHHDYIAGEAQRPAGPRILTVFIYLNYVERGGSTEFPELNVTVVPATGKALLWPSVLDEEPFREDPRTKHQALPVEAGLKFGANAWIHQRDFKTPNEIGCA